MAPSGGSRSDSPRPCDLPSPSRACLAPESAKTLSPWRGLPRGSRSRLPLDAGRVRGDLPQRRLHPLPQRRRCRRQHRRERPVPTPASSISTPARWPAQIRPPSKTTVASAAPHPTALKSSAPRAGLGAAGPKRYHRSRRPSGPRGRAGRAAGKWRRPLVGSPRCPHQRHLAASPLRAPALPGCPPGGGPGPPWPPPSTPGSSPLNGSDGHRRAEPVEGDRTLRTGAPGPVGTGSRPLSRPRHQPRSPAATRPSPAGATLTLPPPGSALTSSRLHASGAAGSLDEPALSYRLARRPSQPPPSRH